MGQSEKAAKNAPPRSHTGEALRHGVHASVREDTTPVRTHPWPQPGPRFEGRELELLAEALRQNTLSYVHGHMTQRLCARMSELTGAAHVVACSSGSAAIHVALKACGVGPGDEVITAPVTDAGTIIGIIYEGAIPVFADVDPVNYNLTAETVAECLTQQTRAVIAVHLAGCPADIVPIAELCRNRGITLIEDCAQSWAAQVNGQWVGTFGDMGCFSLNDYKHISAGEGGLVITNDERLHRTAALAADKCYDRLTRARLMEFVAPNYRISELQSAVALAQLDRVEAIGARRHALGQRLGNGLAATDGLLPHEAPVGAYSTYWFYLIQLDRRFTANDVEDFAKAMNREGIPGGRGYVRPVYLAYPYLIRQSAFHHSRWPFTQAVSPQPYAPGLCPVAESVFDRSYKFPLSEWLDDSDIDDVIRAAQKVSQRLLRRVADKPPSDGDLEGIRKSPGKVHEL